MIVDIVAKTPGYYVTTLRTLPLRNPHRELLYEFWYPIDPMHKRIRDAAYPYPYAGVVRYGDDKANYDLEEDGWVVNAPGFVMAEVAHNIFKRVWVGRDSSFYVKCDKIYEYIDNNMYIIFKKETDELDKEELGIQDGEYFGHVIYPIPEDLKKAFCKEFRSYRESISMDSKVAKTIVSRLGVTIYKDEFNR